MNMAINFNGDMSASRRPKWIPVPDNCDSISLAIGWPATDAPVGTLTLEVCNHGIEGTAGDEYSVPLPGSPAGVAGKWIFDQIKTSCKFIAPVYARTSGGTGAVFTDDSGVAGTNPHFNFMVRG